MEKQKEEIDLVYILVSIKNGFTGSCRWIFNVTMQNFLIVLSFCIIGLGIGFTIFSIKEPVFVSELSISHIRFSNDQCYELVNNLTKLNGKDEQLSKMLKIDIASARKIKSILYLPLNSRVNKLYNDSAMVITPFKVAVEVYNPSVLDSLQTSIMNYLESNEYGVKRKELDKESIEKYINKLKSEGNDVDTLKKIVNQSILRKNQGNGVLIDEPIDPVKITQKSIELYDSQLSYEKKIKLNDSFELMTGFNGGVQQSANALMSMAAGCFYGYLAVLLFFLVRRKKVS
jgi:hypothetical protein